MRTLGQLFGRVEPQLARDEADVMRGLFKENSQADYFATDISDRDALMSPVMKPSMNKTIRGDELSSLPQQIEAIIGL